MTSRSIAGILVSAVFSVALISFPVWAAHPLITDDTGTQGKGKFQIELNGAYASDKETVAGEETKAIEWGAETVLSYGVVETMDVVLGLVHIRAEETVNGVTTRERGTSDGGLLVKWRFWESEHASFAFKPGLIIPLGSENRGLGTGKYGYLWFLVATQEGGKWAFHENIGQVRNRNRADERDNLYHLSLAAEYELTEGIDIVANLRQEKNPDKTSKRDLAFALAGIIFEVSENVDVDIGYQVALTDPEVDSAVLAGLAVRF